MRVPLSFINNLLHSSISPHEFEQISLKIGLEVENVYELGKNVVVGRIIDISYSNQYSLLKINIGKKIVHSVSLSKSIKKGDKVWVALSNSILLTHTADIKEIKEEQISGYTSEAMICSEGELGLSNAFNTIAKVKENLTEGTSLAKASPTLHDFIFDLSITPDKAYLLGLNYLAKEILVFLKINYNKEIPQYHLPSVDFSSCPLPTFSINISHPDCFSYTGLLVKNISQSKKIPEIESLLLKCGLPSINNVVDIANYVTITTGQPIHSFPFEIFQNEVLITSLAEKSPFLALNKKLYEISSDDIVISNGKEALCLAGIIGSYKHAVLNHHKDILFEIAYFSPKRIRQTSKRLGISTEASYRFERYQNPYLMKVATHFIAYLMKKYFPECTIYAPKEVNPPPPPPQISINLNKVKKIIGIPENNEPEKIIKIIKESVGNVSIDASNSNFIFICLFPEKSFIRNENDIAEEILRFSDMNTIEISKHQPFFNSYPPTDFHNYKIINAIKVFLIGNGFSEIITTSLIKNIPNNPNVLKIFQPKNKDFDTLRPSLFYSGIYAINNNLNRKITNFKFFEIGKIWLSSNNTINERKSLALWGMGESPLALWSNFSYPNNSYLLKSITEKLLQFLNINYTIKELQQDKLPPHLSFYHEILNWGIIFFNNFEFVGICGKVNYPTPLFFAEIILPENPSELVLRNIPHYKNLSPFPFIIRDLSLEVEISTKWDTLHSIISTIQKEIPEIENFTVFDIYSPPQLTQKNKKAIGIRFILRSPTTTLTDPQADEIINNIYSFISSKIYAKRR